MKNIKEKFIKNEMSETRAFYTCLEKNKLGETLTVEVSECYPNNKDKNSLPRLWKMHGYTNKLYNSYLCITCYITDKKGDCWERYNPTIKLSADKKRNVINFENLMEVSEENKTILLNKIYSLFMEA